MEKRELTEALKFIPAWVSFNKNALAERKRDWVTFMKLYDHLI